jgi:hypothetical protein
MPLEIRCSGPTGDPDVDDTPLGENPRVGRPDGWGRVPFVGRDPQSRRRVLCGAEPNGCGGTVREADTPCGTQLRVGARPLCELGWVGLWYVMFCCVRLG